LEEEWKIVRIFDTNKVLKKEFADGYTFLDTVHSSVDMSDSVQNSHEEYQDEYLQKKHGKLVYRELCEFPLAREVELMRGKPHSENKHCHWVIIRSDRFPILYELLESYHKGIRLVSREEKYRNLYQVYEQLSKEQNQELKSIRHSRSHSRKKLTDKKTAETLHSLFGDTKINLAKYKHAKIFRQKLKLLKSKSEILLIEEILKILPLTPNFLGVYYMP
jgi:hypothetical protein